MRMTQQMHGFHNRLLTLVNSGRGIWIAAQSNAERAMAMRMVKGKVLDTDDGYLFRLYDPDWHAFIVMLEDEFLRRRGRTRKNAAKDEKEYAARYTSYLLERALSDGQGGWNLTFKRYPEVWDAKLAAELVSRYVEMQDYEER